MTKTVHATSIGPMIELLKTVPWNVDTKLIVLHDNVFYPVKAVEIARDGSAIVLVTK